MFKSPGTKLSLFGFWSDSVQVSKTQAKRLSPFNLAIQLSRVKLA
jgi:hypothetical protein